MSDDASRLFLGLVAVLVTASLVAGVLSWRSAKPLPATLENLNARIKAWWIMVAGISLAFLFGKGGVILLFAFVSFAALREYVTVTNTRRADRWTLLGMFLIMPFGGRLYPVLGPRYMMAMGFAVISVTIGSMLFVDYDTSLWIFRSQLFLMGIGMALTIIPSQTATFEDISGPETANASALISTTRQVASAAGVALMSTILASRLDERFGFEGVIGNSPQMVEVIQRLQRIAPTDATVLIEGETGTGKELVAKAIHQNSPRKKRPFVPLNCAALSEHILESELFGHVKGAFTDASSDRQGKFEYANGGTLFLDEVGDMPVPTQIKLLRVLESGEIRRVGDNVPSFVDVRVVAAANEPLEQRIKEGTFREDLYYRLNVIQIQLPALRDRRDDIPLLVAHFLSRRQRPGCDHFQVSRRAMDFLLSWSWPGNVRELENAMERATTLCETTTIRLADLPPSLLAKAGVNAADDQGPETAALPALNESEFSQAAATTTTATGGMKPNGKPMDSIKPLKNFLREQEQAYLNRVMETAGGDKEQAAILLGVSLATLYRKLSGEDREG